MPFVYFPPWRVGFGIGKTLPSQNAHPQTVYFHELILWRRRSEFPTAADNIRILNR